MNPPALDRDQLALMLALQVGGWLGIGCDPEDIKGALAKVLTDWNGVEGCWKEATKGLPTKEQDA